MHEDLVEESKTCLSAFGWRATPGKNPRKPLNADLSTGHQNIRFDLALWREKGIQDKELYTIAHYQDPTTGKGIKQVLKSLYC
jgi:hypothetical protein